MVFAIFGSSANLLAAMSCLIHFIQDFQKLHVTICGIGVSLILIQNIRRTELWVNLYTVLIFWDFGQNPSYKQRKGNSLPFVDQELISWRIANFKFNKESKYSSLKSDSQNWNNFNIHEISKVIIKWACLQNLSV